MPLKKDRVKAVKDLMHFVDGELNQIKTIKIFNVTCPECNSPVDDETGLCLNCGK